MPMTPTSQTLDKIDKIKNDINRTMLHCLQQDSVHPDLVIFFNECSKILLSADAKRIRSIISVLVGESLGLDREECLLKGILIELIHFTSLIHDDVIDHDTVRRGRPTLNNLFAVNHAVLIGDFMMSEMINMGLNMKDGPTLIRLMLEAIKKLVTGLLIEQDVLPRKPTLENYFEMVACKTGSLFELSFSYPLVGHPQFRQAALCGMHFGLLFQIYDDYLDRDDDQSNINIFHLMPKVEIIDLWNHTQEQLHHLSKEVGIESVVTDIEACLQANNYFQPFDDF